jgi:hypothetical protein
MDLNRLEVSKKLRADLMDDSLTSQFAGAQAPADPERTISASDTNITFHFVEHDEKLRGYRRSRL